MTIKGEDRYQLPLSYGCYVCVGEEVVYIGRSKLLRKRVGTHRLWHKILKELDDVTVRYSLQESDYNRESELIKQYQPKYNICQLDKHTVKRGSW